MGISDEFIITAAHCVDLHFKKHFQRTKRIFRFSSYDSNYLHGDLAVIQLDSKVEFSETLKPACLPEDPNETFGNATAISTGWGITEETKLKPPATTSKVLRETNLYILDQDKCVAASPFLTTDAMICTYKGPYGVETTCQGDSGGPLVVNTEGEEGGNRY